MLSPPHISLGILRDKTIDEKITINKIIPSVDQNHWLKRLDTTSLKQTNQNKNTQSFVSEQKNLGTIVFYSPMSPISLSELNSKKIIFLFAVVFLRL